MPTNHPDIPAHGDIHFCHLMWRFFTGAHLDGVKYTDAGWFKKGSANHRLATWWTVKPRFHRLLWRWATVAIPVAIYVSYKHAPLVYVNLAAYIWTALAPFILWRAGVFISARIPRTREIIITRPADTPETVMDSSQWGTLEDSDISELEDMSIPVDGIDPVRRRPNRRQS